MSKKKLTKSKTDMLEKIYKQFDAVLDGIREEIAKNDPNGVAWRRFLTRNINRHFPKQLAETESTESCPKQSNKLTNDVLKRHGIRLQVETAQAIVAAMSMRIDYLTDELRSKASDMTPGEIMIAIHDCCRMAILFGTEKRIRCAPRGWTMSPTVLRQREQLIEDEDEAADLKNLDLLEVFGNKAGAPNGKAKP